MLTEAAIESAERMYRSILEDFFSEIWGDTILYSHGIDHHRRVWHYASRLLIQQKPREIKSRCFLAEKLIIACYLHDLGMSVNPGIRHGVYSRELCRKFLYDNGLNENEFTDLLDAIESHDKKDYDGSARTRELATILSAADDLDALGYTGIFRYLEIYLARGVRPDEAGIKISKNARRRFENLIVTFPDSPVLISECKIRYKVLDDFFSGYNQAFSALSGQVHPKSGYILLNQLVVDLNSKGVSEETFLEISQNYSSDRVVRNFFLNLYSELKS
jgi:HD superfamily phosphodiesterase